MKIICGQMYVENPFQTFQNGVFFIFLSTYLVKKRGKS